MEPWDLIRGVLYYAVYPLVMGLVYFMRSHIQKVNEIEKDLQDTKTRTAVIESKVDDVRDDIKEIKENVQKLVERRP